MRRTLILSLLVAACGGTALQPARTIADVDAPEPVRQELERVFGARAQIRVEVEEDDDGQPEWETHTLVEMELEQRADGTIHKIEFAVPVALAPEAVRGAAQAQFSGATLSGAEVVVRGGELLWEVEATRGEEELEAYFRVDGTLVE
ncbi:MAG: hypothetical protein AAF645_01265 [Myxococcota bacterium]